MLADGYILVICGRVIQSSEPLRYAIVEGMNVRARRLQEALLLSAGKSTPSTACARLVSIAGSSLVEQPHGLFDQKPRHPNPDDQDCTRVAE